MAIYFDDQLVAGINSIDDSVLSNYVKFSDLFDDPSASIEEIKKTIAGLGLTLNNKDFYILVDEGSDLRSMNDVVIETFGSVLGVTDTANSEQKTHKMKAVNSLWLAMEIIKRIRFLENATAFVFILSDLTLIDRRTTSSSNVFDTSIAHPDFSGGKTLTIQGRWLPNYSYDTHTTSSTAQLTGTKLYLRRIYFDVFHNGWNCGMSYSGPLYVNATNVAFSWLVFDGGMDASHYNDDYVEQSVIEGGVSKHSRSSVFIRGNNGASVSFARCYFHGCFYGGNIYNGDAIDVGGSLLYTGISLTGGNLNTRSLNFYKTHEPLRTQSNATISFSHNANFSRFYNNFETGTGKIVRILLGGSFTINPVQGDSTDVRSPIGLYETTSADYDVKYGDKYYKKTNNILSAALANPEYYIFNISKKAKSDLSATPVYYDGSSGHDVAEFIQSITGGSANAVGYQSNGYFSISMPDWMRVATKSYQVVGTVLKEGMIPLTNESGYWKCDASGQPIGEPLSAIDALDLDHRFPISTVGPS